MQNFPHNYTVTAAAAPDGTVSLDGKGMPRMLSAPPVEFDGPGDRWSPETLLVAAVADCFALTFRGIARVSKFPWLSLTCEASGTLDRVDRVTQFTDFRLHASLHVPEGTDEAQARKLLERTEHACLIANSLKAASHLEADVRVGNFSLAGAN